MGCKLPANKKGLTIFLLMYTYVIYNMKIDYRRDIYIISSNMYNLNITMHKSYSHLQWNMQTAKRAGPRFVLHCQCRSAWWSPRHDLIPKRRRKEFEFWYLDIIMILARLIWKSGSRISVPKVLWRKHRLVDFSLGFQPMIAPIKEAGTWTKLIARVIMQTQPLHIHQLQQLKCNQETLNILLTSSGLGPNVLLHGCFETSRHSIHQLIKEKTFKEKLLLCPLCHGPSWQSSVIDGFNQKF